MHEKSCIFVHIYMILVNIVGGGFAMLSPTKLLGDMSPVRPRRFRHINAYLQQTTTYLLANLLVRSADSSYSLFLSRSESASSVGGW